jgi:hypothetical protein
VAADTEFYDAYLDTCRDLIARHGHLVQGYGTDTPVAYTVGLCEARGYELAISGLPQQTAMVVLNRLANVIAGREPREGVRVDDALADGYALRLRQVIRAEYDFGLIEQLYGRPYPIWQALWPDVEGRFPSDPECTLTADAQALL